MEYDTHMYSQKLASIRALILDCDGVLTDGRLYYSARGSEMLTFHSKDGWGLAELSKRGFPIAVLSGRSTDIAEARMRQLGVSHFVGSCHDKAAGFLALCRILKQSPEHVAYIGDDIPDLPAFQHAGLRIAVADAAQAVRDVAEWVTQARGGAGAVREVIDALLEVVPKESER